MTRKSLIYLLMVVSSCHHQPASSTYEGVFFSEESHLDPLLDLAYPSNGVFLLDENWEFGGVDSLPGMEQELFKWVNNGEKVTLPHRLSQPNQSLWYRWKGSLEPGKLFLNGDDGTQLWINGKRTPRSEDGDYYSIGESGELELTVRVINNAQSGGLKRAFWMKEADFLKWQSIWKTSFDSLLYRRKIDLLLDQSLKSKLSDMTSGQKELLDSYPILLTEPTVILDSKGRPYLRWKSEIGGPAKIQIAGDENWEVILGNEDGLFTVPVAFQQTYSVQIHQDKSFFGPFHFDLTLPKESLKMAIWGDSQGGWETFRTIANQIGKQQADVSIGLGDLVNNGSEPLVYSRFLQLVSKMKTPQVLIPGNHDYDGYYEDLIAREMETHLSLPGDRRYGFQNLGIVGILTLDPNGFFPVSLPENSAQRVWLDSMLNSDLWSKIPWKVVALHQPPYSQGWPGYQGEFQIRELLKPYFHSGKIDMVMAGHTHDYERLTLTFSGNPVHFFIFGGAGGKLEPKDQQSDYPKMDKLHKVHHFGMMEFSKASFSLNVIDLDGQVIDQFSHSK